MKKAVALLCGTVGLSGCLTSDVLVTVRPDGSGTVEHTTIVRPSAMAQFQTLVSPELGAKPPDPVVISRELQRYAVQARLGRNLRIRSTRVLNTPDTTGGALTYDFDDVTGMDLDLMPQVPGLQGLYRVAATDAGASTRLKATLEPIAGGLLRLTIHFPRFAMDPSAEPPASWASGSPAEMTALRNVMHGSRVTIVVKTEAPMVRTNSPYRDENRVTLFDADIEEALFSKQIGMLATTPSTFDELLTALSDLPGVTLARERDITIDFEDPSRQPASVAPAQGAAPPDTEVFLASLSSLDGRLTIGPPINMSNNPGYDNQRAFTPDGRQVLYSSARQGSAPPRASGTGQPAAPPQTDIYRYEIASRRMWRVTNTPEGEYSPTVMPDGKRISVVRVEADGTQRLWSVTDGDSKSETSVILADIKPVGYHAWIDERTVALFVLGEREQPATLQVADTGTGKAEIITTNIGRSLQRMPSGAISFVQREPASGETAPAAMITQLLNAKAAERGASRTAALIRPAAGATDPYLAWTPDGTMLMAVNSTVYRWRIGEPDWTVVANLETFGLREVSRLAVSPKGDRLAIVARAK